MRISDWSSDVCSSDLGRKLRGAHGLVEVALGIAAGHVLDQPGDFRFVQHELARERFHRNPAELFGHEAVERVLIHQARTRRDEAAEFDRECTRAGIERIYQARKSVVSGTSGAVRLYLDDARILKKKKQRTIK